MDVIDGSSPTVTVATFYMCKECRVSDPPILCATCVREGTDRGSLACRLEKDALWIGVVSLWFPQFSSFQHL